ncbi:MAG: hypothetical protein AMXMBFR4_34260 [Candidatus Hydrogenedentota bacterium]
MKQVLRDSAWFGAVLLLSVMIGALIWLTGPTPGPARPLEHICYVWQRQWAEPVRQAVSQAGPHFDGLMVLVGEIDGGGDALKLSPVRPDWVSVAGTGRPITLVLRANAALGDVAAGEKLREVSGFVAQTFRGVADEARAGGVTVAGVQLDYDCPTSKLGAYADLIGALHNDLAGHDLSITALPTWLRWSEFDRLLSHVSYYVLQVHSLNPPTTIDRPLVLCDTSRIPAYLRRAATFGRPFYLALPTYGYRVVFDASGTFAALSAEGPAPAPPAGGRIRTVSADPAAMARVVRELTRRPPHGLIGIAWFRMPVESDELNWTLPALLAVREGREPSSAVAAELRSASAGLFEVWIRNSGEISSSSTVSLAVEWPGGRPLAYDVHNGFSAIEETGRARVRLTGPAPRSNDAVLAAWFRVAPNDGVTVPPPVLGPVEYLP